jgi:hypothetical protein
MPPFEIQVFSPSSYIAVAVPMRRAAHGADIRPGIRFGQGEGGNGSPGGHARQVIALLLPPCPCSVMAPLPRPCMAKAKSARPECRASVSRIRQMRARVDGVGTTAPGLAAHGIADPVRGTQLAHQRDTGASVSAAPRMRRVVDVFVRPAIEGQRQFLVVPFEEGPVEIGSVCHAQFPSNTGFCLATKAW